jgi:hypothetical protein
LIRSTKTSSPASIGAKRVDLPYQSGRSKRWLKIKNPASPAARRADEGSF